VCHAHVWKTPASRLPSGSYRRGNDVGVTANSADCSQAISGHPQERTFRFRFASGSRQSVRDGGRTATACPNMEAKQSEPTAAKPKMVPSSGDSAAFSSAMVSVLRRKLLSTAELSQHTGRVHSVKSDFRPAPEEIPDGRAHTDDDSQGGRAMRAAVAVTELIRARLRRQSEAYHNGNGFGYLPAGM
jgi:hypothetical protein